MLNTFSKILLLLLLPVQVCFAQLVPIDEAELSEMTGQAFVNFDQTSNGDLDFTKISFGLDVETSLNADLMELGKYDRAGEAAGSADIRISDFALGEIDDNGNIVPFEISDPFIELAYEDDNGTQNLVGVRLGFGGALGKLSGNIESLTGNVDVKILGRAEPVRDAAGWFLAGIMGIAGIGDDRMLTADAELVDINTGSADTIRASAVGMLDGDQLFCESGSCIIDWFSSNNCKMLGIATCFPLANFKSLDIGNNGQKSEGLFLSFQTKEITWIDGNTSTPTVSGAFMNIPDGGIIVDFEQAFNGTARARTKYIDPYFGEF